MIEDTADYLYSELHKQGAFEARSKPASPALLKP
jgi:hypothetical protein